MKGWKGTASILFAGILFVTASFANAASETEHDLRQGGALALTEDGGMLLAVNPDSNTLTFVDTASRQRVAEIPVGIDPRCVALARDDLTAYVANQGTDSISVIDVVAQTETGVIPVGDRPVQVDVSPDGRFLAIAELGDDRVRFVDLRDLSTLTTIAVGDRPHGLAFTPDGTRLLVTHLLSGEVTVLYFEPFSAFFPIMNRGIGPTSPLPSSTSPGLQRQFPNIQITTWPNVAPAPNITVNQAGTRAYLPQSMANGQGWNIQFDSTIFPKVSVLDLGAHTHLTAEHISLPETDQPVGLPWAAALTKDDTELWVVNAASNDISVVDLSDPTHPRRAAHLIVEDNPRGIVIDDMENTVYVNNTLAGTVSVIDAETYSVTGVIISTEIPLPPLLLNGKRLFNSSANPAMAQAKWIACSTCHIEGEHDGRTWKLQFTGETGIRSTAVITRNTTTLLGMVETYPLRWSANWDESADSEFAIRFEQFGTGLIEGEVHPALGVPNQGRSYELDSLAAYLDSLQVPARIQVLTPAEQRGRAIFESPVTSCLVCHPPPYYTDFLTHNVGTADATWELFGPDIDTPTLRFLYDSAPYLHDGSAETLLQLLTTANPEDKHGETSGLNEQELNDLILFLLALPYQD